MLLSYASFTKITDKYWYNERFASSFFGILLRKRVTVLSYASFTTLLRTATVPVLVRDKYWYNERFNSRSNMYIGNCTSPGEAMPDEKN